jgi:LysR family hydrogen peroxide-inducible transcriptional activator
MISLKQLAYAVAVAETLHFKQAAEKMHVSQSALSTAISELEKQLGIILFERNNKQVMLTVQGELFLERAKSIKLAVDDLYQLARSQQAPLSTPMTIGVIPTIAPYLLPKVLPTLRQQYPGFELTLVEDQSHELLKQLRRGELDSAILALPFDIDGLLSFEFWQEDFYWVTHKEDAVAFNRAEIKSEDIVLENLMLLKEGHCLKDHALLACKAPIASVDYSMNATSLQTLVQLVAAQMGSTLVPEMALENLVYQQPMLTALHLKEPSPHRRIAFITRPNYVDVNSIMKLKSLFQQALNFKKTDQ